ncbi:lytic transglycosylase domain-containing protein [Lentzea sp. NPDC059081]|uniref:lytic transglycosylase domain-containing protein n=1 Tax=Lentzea sp. NPDC059081 TaxID=3346719 RepID=UPI00369DF56C
MRLALALTVLTAAGASTLWQPPPGPVGSSSPGEVPREVPWVAQGAESRADRAGGTAVQPAAAVSPVALTNPAQPRTAPGPVGAQGIPGNVLDAYRAAADLAARTTPRCKLPWHLLASIGRIESGHARGGRADAAGTTSPAILGPVLAGGPGVAAIRDTDGGRWDGDGTWDRAVGPMQFIPGTWARYGTDGNGDGVASPHNVFDATAAAAGYLCSGGMDLSRPGDRRAAVFRYNHSESYVDTVLAWSEAYATGTRVIPAALVSHAVDQTARPPAPATAPAKPAVVAAPDKPAAVAAPAAPAPTSKPEAPPAPSATASATSSVAPTATTKPEPPRRPAWTEASATLLKVCLKMLSRGHEGTPAHARRCAATFEEAVAAGVVTEDEVEAARTPR